MGLKKGFRAKWSPTQQAAYWLVIELKWCEAEYELVGAGPEGVERVHDTHAKLVRLYKPHWQLPPPGQGLWRKLCHLWDTSKERNYELTCALDDFCEWLVAFYEIGSGPEGRPQKAPADNPYLQKLNKTQRTILAAVGEEPLYAREIATKVRCDDTTARKHLSTLYKLGLIDKHPSGQGYVRK